MQPVEFKESNFTYAKNQPPYLPLPVHKDGNGVVTSCWKMTLRERIKALWTGKVYFTALTFNTPLQPQRPSIDKPMMINIEYDLKSLYKVP